MGCQRGCNPNFPMSWQPKIHYMQIHFDFMIGSQEGKSQLSWMQ